MGSQTVNIAYHYTSIDTFSKMLDGIKYNHFLFHGSYILSMNDPLEFKYGFNQVHRLLKSIENELMIDTGDRLSRIWEEDETREEQIKMLSDTFSLPFVVCFSNHKDYLPQWIMYGDNGYGVSLGFSIQDYCKISKLASGMKILDFTDFDEKKMYAIKVSYKSISGRHSFRIFLKNLYKEYIEKLQAIKDTESRIKTQLEYLKTIAFHLPTLIKHKAYSYEDETRLLFFRSNASDVKLKTNTKGQTIPYIKVGVEVDRLKKIVVGPQCDFESTKLILETRLKQLNIEKVEIVKSQIPFR